MNVNFLGIYNENCFDFVKKLSDNSVNLIVTSPPYSDQRENTYGGIHPDDYVEWFKPLAKDLLRVLTDDGSFILNIKEKVVNGERHTYVMELIIALRKLGWKYTEEYVWHKTTSMPGKWPNRFRDAWERCIHFTKNKKFKMNQDAVQVPIGDWTKARMKNLSENDIKRYSSKTKSGFGKNLKNWEGKETANPDNVLDFSEDTNQNRFYRNFGEDSEFCNVIKFAPECGNKEHSAVFPIKLPEWFIKLFSDENDIVFDPFLGSGTTALAAKKLNRKYIGTEINIDYFNISKKRIENSVEDEILLPLMSNLDLLDVK